MSDKRRAREEAHSKSIKSVWERAEEADGEMARMSEELGDRAEGRTGYERDVDPYKGQTDKERRNSQALDDYARKRLARTRR